MSFTIYGFDLLSLKGAYLCSIIFLAVWLYAYIFYLYRAQMTGKEDYEKYGRLALQDSIDDSLIESCDTSSKHDKYVYIFYLCRAQMIYLCRAQMTGKEDYEKYGRLALQDSIDDALIESCDTSSKHDKVAERR